MPHFVVLDEINNFWFVTAMDGGYVAQFDLSSYEDSVFCVRGMNRNLIGYEGQSYNIWEECIAAEDDM